MSKSSESNAQPGDYSQQYCIIYITDARRLDHNCSHHEKEMIIMWQDGSVSKVVHYIKVSHQHEYTLKMHRVMLSVTSQTNKQTNKKTDALNFTVAGFQPPTAIYHQCGLRQITKPPWEGIHVCGQPIHFTVSLKLTQHCKSPVPQ